ncbi:MAG: fumarylacetoacetate hydrolase family protein [Candidimonas sp.]
MKLVSFLYGNASRVGVLEGDQVRVLPLDRGHDVGSLAQKAAQGAPLSELTAGADATVALADVALLPPVVKPGKIICVGLNYKDHTAESDYQQPDYPTFFLRLTTSLTAHDAPIERPLASDSLDFEGELAVIIGKAGRHIAKESALEHIFGYSVFNDGSVREYQFKSPQWTIGKTFDKTGGFGPAVVTADALPAGAHGLDIQTRLNGEVVQSSNTRYMIHDVVELVAVLSEAITLEPGDVVVAGTPSGIGWARNPRLLMRDGDVCEVTIEGIGTLRNPIVDEARN